MGTRRVREFTDDIAGWAIIAPKQFSVLHGIHKSDQWIRVARRRNTHSIILWEDGTRSAGSKGASNTCGALPDDLGEVRGLRVSGVIILGFVLPHVDPVGDAESASSSGQVFCKT